MVRGSILAEARGVFGKMWIGWTVESPILRLDPLLLPGVGLCACNTRRPLCMAFTCIPGQPGLWGLGGQEQVEAGGGGGREGVACLEQAGGTSRSQPALLSCPGGPGLVSAPPPTPPLPWAWNLWLGGEPRTIHPHCEACSPAQHLSEFIRERKRGRGSANCIRGVEQKWPWHWCWLRKRN